jgi:hypothetical protein
MDQERMLFCVLHHPMDAEKHNIPPEDVVLCSASPNGCRDTQHPTWRVQIRSFSVGITEACTPPGVLLRYL